MKIDELSQHLHLKYPVLSFTRMNYQGDPTDLGKGCTLNGALHKALDGEVVYISAGSGPCYGGDTGIGLVDGIPNTPGGFGHFIAYGRGDGFPTGERIKCNPELAEQMITNQPQEVMEDFNAVCIKQWEPTDEADLVSFMVNPDSLSALIHLFNFRHADYDNVIAPMTSGCSSLFRIPFGEMMRDSHRAVIGNVDIAARVHFDADTFFFTISNKDFLTLLADADESIFKAPYWRKVEKRMV